MTRARVLVIGESLIDIVTDADGRTTEVVGGSPANVALGLARQQVAVQLLTALGRDAYGERISAHLTGPGIDIVDASWSLSSTSTARARIVAGGAAEYAFDLTWALPSPTRLPPVRLVHVGSIGAFLEPGATTLDGWLDVREPGVLLTFDPNVRPALLPGRGEALARFERLAAQSDVVKLSDEDADWLYPGREFASVAERALALGARLVALTRGGFGAELYGGDVSVTVPAPVVTVRDTVGAGDTFMAALIQRVLASPELLRSPTASSLAGAGAYAVAAAALTVQRVGADLPTAAEIRAALA